METELPPVEYIPGVLKISKFAAQRWYRAQELPVARIGKAYLGDREGLEKWYEGKLLENAGGIP
ncbi:MAG TPA: hypothetical protein VMW64_05370 [Dehalococcoidia bacterium]|nr:hypothetical protein [Dehalococcoidia bacterium]